jgi:putative peptidoglycan lipid II flippase
MPHAASPDAAPPKASNVVRSAGVVALGTLASRILGALRDVVIAASFSLAATDSFFVAFTIPNALRALLAEGAVSAAFVPLYTEALTREGPERAKEVHRTLSGAFLAVLALVSVLGVLAAPAFVTAYAAGYGPERYEGTVLLTRIVFPYIFFVGSAALGMAALNANGRFAVPALTPALLNVALIAAPFALVPLVVPLGLEPVVSLAVAALVGGALQVVAQWPALRAIDHLHAPRLALGDPVVRRAAALLLPVAFGLGIYQVNVMLARLFVSYLPTGAQSYLYYGQRLVEIPQGMFALALASASLPRLSALRAHGDVEGVRQTFLDGLRHTLFIALPASAVLVVLAEPIVTVLFERGAFGHDDAIQTARSLAWQGAGVVCIALVRVFVPVFHAHGDTRGPVWASAANLAAFAALALALRGPFGHVGVAIAISAAGIAQLGLLAWLLRRKLGRMLPASARPAGLAGGALRLALGSLLAAAAGGGLAQLGDWPRGGNDSANVAVLGGALLAAGAVYLAALWALRAPELQEVLAALRRRRRR